MGSNSTENGITMMQRPRDFFNENYLDALLAGMDGTRKELPKIAQASEAVAERLVAGGGQWG